MQDPCLAMYSHARVHDGSDSAYACRCMYMYMCMHVRTQARGPAPIAHGMHREQTLEDLPSCAGIAALSRRLSNC